MSRRTLHRIGAALLLCSTACTRTPARTQPTAEGAWLRPTPAGEMASIYLTLHNPTDTPLILTAVTVAGVPHATFHESTDHAGMAHMADRDTLLVPAHDSVALAPRGLHVMAHGLPRAAALRDSLAVTFTTRAGSTLSTWALVRE